jgi:ABC-type amino acid transport substrate-binding protein
VADYEQQNYGFALALRSTAQHELNVNLVQLRESGVLDRIATRWLGGE